MYTKKTIVYGYIDTDFAMGHLENEVKVLKSSNVGEKGEEVDWKKYKELIAEYRKFKTNCVKHFRFSSAASSYAYRESRSLFLAPIGALVVITV